MISLLDVAERARTGLRMTDKEWELNTFRKVQKLTLRHGLRKSLPEKFSEVDNSYVDSLFQAAVDFLTEMGVFCTSTGRVLRFSDDEVREAVREAPSKVSVGAGKDASVFGKREFEDTRPPSIDVSGHGPWADSMTPLPIVVRELARHPRVGLLEGYMFAQIDGREVHGSPMCAYAARRALQRIREGLLMAGRPGLAVTYYPVRTDAFSLIAPMDPDHGLRRTDGILLTILPDLKVEEDMIAAALVYSEYGCYGQCGGTGTGPFGGDVEGRMIESTAGPLAAWLVYRDSILSAGGVGEVYTPFSARKEDARGSTKRLGSSGLSWRDFAILKSLLRNTNQIYYSIIWGESVGLDDLVSEEYLLRVALSSIRSTVLGLNFRVGCTNPPTFTSWVVDTSDAAIKSKIKVEDLEELFQRVRTEKLGGEHVFLGDLPDRRMLIYGDRPQDFLSAGLKAYDWVMQRPTEEYRQNERKARKYLTDLGLDLL